MTVGVPLSLRVLRCLPDDENRVMDVIGNEAEVRTLVALSLPLVSDRRAIMNPSAGLKK